MSLGLKLHYFAAVTSGLTLFAGLTPWSKYELAQRIGVLAHPLVERHITPFSRQMRWPQKSTRHWRRTAPKPFHVLLGRESGLPGSPGMAVAGNPRVRTTTETISGDEPTAVITALCPNRPKFQQYAR